MKEAFPYCVQFVGTEDLFEDARQVKGSTFVSHVDEYRVDGGIESQVGYKTAGLNWVKLHVCREARVLVLTPGLHAKELDLCLV